MSEPYVPTTEQVRLEYATSFLAAYQQDAREGFDRWLAATLEDGERFCHLCCAGLESSQHNTECIGSDNGLAAHDREAKAEALREASVALWGDGTAARGTTKAMYNAIYATWLMDRADRIESQETP